MSNLHYDDKDAFIEAVRSTAGREGFSEALVEKDYFCSIVLREIFKSNSHQLVFKGGTLLNKTHIGFYRLSEDLDFSINAKPEFTRVQRSSLAKSAKKSIIDAVKKMSLKFSKKFKGQNESKQYDAEIIYDSLVLGTNGSIKIEISLREKVLQETSLKAKTLVYDPFSQDRLIHDFAIRGLSLEEAYGEKIRAALSRRSGPAIRDIFDVYYAFEKGLISIENISKMAKYKITSENRTINLSNNRKMEFRSQLETELKPVLRLTDYDAFDFEKAWDMLTALEKEISSII